MPNTYQKGDRELVFTRTFQAPLKLVWNAWTDQNQIEQWFGPYGYTNSTKEADIRKEGKWEFVMHGENGIDYPNLITFDEIIEHEKIIYTHGTGEVDDTSQFQVTVTFAEKDGLTYLTMTMLFTSAQALEEVKKFGAVEGAHQTLDKLAKYLGVN